MGAAWLLVTLAGLAAVARYDNTAGVAAAAHGEWPRDSRLRPATDAPTLVMVAHPRCTCTRASLDELAEILARTAHRPRTYVVFTAMQPADRHEVTDLWNRASRLTDVTVVRDADGREAAAFGAETSGQVFLYGATGELLFAGGTTGSRGHPGNNAGRAAILAILDRQPPGRATTPVFGCSLFGPGDRSDGPHGTAHHSHD